MTPVQWLISLIFKYQLHYGATDEININTFQNQSKLLQTIERFIRQFHPDITTKFGFDKIYRISIHPVGYNRLTILVRCRGDFGEYNIWFTIENGVCISVISK
jgi:hypothetical protein